VKEAIKAEEIPDTKVKSPGQRKSNKHQKPLRKRKKQRNRNPGKRKKLNPIF
jgi:hypothetical protein